LLVLISHHVVSVLYRFLYLLFACLREVKLHYYVVLELGFADEVQPSFSLGENSKIRQVLLCGLEAIKIFYYEVGVLPELDEEVLVRFDALKLPLIALEEKVEVNLGVARELHFYCLGELVLVLDHHFHPQLLGLFQGLNHLRLLLDLDDEAVLARIDDLASLSDCRVLDRSRGLDNHHVQY
jgi:hypothetical protein